MNFLLQPTYFPDILSAAAMLQAHKLLFEVCDNYQKQSYRNRMYIATANGKLLLNIPVKHTHRGRHKKTAEAQLENSFNWQRQHWRSLLIAYRTSPFFEFYEDELYPLFHTDHESLLALNLASIKLVFNMLNCDLSFDQTSDFQKEYSEYADLRVLANAKKKPKIHVPRYRQVFEDKNEFIPHLSVLDLIFNLGPESQEYLKKIPLPV